MKDLNRNGRPFPSSTYLRAQQNDSHVCRVLSGCALITIQSFAKLDTAKRYMHYTAAHVPGSYVVFSKTSRQVFR